MKPWPAALLARYPVRTGHYHQVAERPWWSGSTTGDGLLLFRLPGEEGITVEWRKQKSAYPAERGNAYVRYPPNADGCSFSIVYAKHGTEISTFGPEAVRAFGENYDAKMSMDTHDDLLALLARIDRERPLPHPGVRVGQIWSDSEGIARQIAETGDAACIGPCGWDHHDRLIEPLRYRFLVADPACPHLAPWSPAEAA